MTLKIVKLDTQEDPSLYRFDEGAQAQLKADQKPYKKLQEKLHTTNVYYLREIQKLQEAHNAVIRGIKEGLEAYDFHDPYWMGTGFDKWWREFWQKYLGGE